jgi:BolA protein
MTVQEIITQKIAESLTPVHMHNVPPGSESHFKLVIVTDAFDGLPRVQRHQRVNGILEQEFKDGMHALSMQTMTPQEWTAKGHTVMESPACLGGGKHGN